jgi:putative aldouronate transport system substrate-binding protein
MKTKKALLSALLIIMLAVGFGVSSRGPASAQDAVTLKIVLPGDRPAQMDEIIAEAESRMAEDGLNIKLNVVFIPWSDLGNISVQLAAGEPIDLAFDAPWLTMEQNISQEFYIKLDDLLAEYGPNVLNTRPQALWDHNKYGDGIYVIPLRGASGGGKCYIVRKDIREALGLEPIQTMEDLEAFLYAVKEAYPDMVPMGPGPDGPAIHFMFHEWDTSVRTAGSGRDYILYFTGNDGIVHNMFDEPFAPWFEHANRVAKWRKDGLLPQEMVPTGDTTYSIEAGNIAISPANDMGWLPQTEAAVKELGGELEWFTFYDQSKRPVGAFFAWNFIAVPYSSKHPVEAVQFLNWANAKENYDLLAYGIEGENWTAVGEEEYVPNPDNLYRWYPYAWVWNPVYDRMDASMPDGANEWSRWTGDPDNYELDVLATFKVDSSPVLNEISELNALADQYFMPLSYGVVDDVDAWWAEYEGKAASLARIVQQEYQRQIDAFLASQG